MSVQGLGGRLGDLAGAMRVYRRRPAVGDSRERLVALQRQRLVDVVRHAAGASALYRELYSGIDLSDDIDLSALPVVS